MLPSSGVAPSQSAISAFRDIANYNNNNTVILATALRELRQHMPFTQLRFHCHKAAVGRTVHIITASNSTGFEVVNYFTAQTDILPMACQSFYRGPKDNSELAGECAKWGYEGGYRVGKWSHQTRVNDKRVFDHVFFVVSRGHFISYPSSLRCDVPNDIKSPGDFWQTYVR